MSPLRTVKVKRAMYECERSQKTDDRKWEEERRCMKTKETMHK